MKKKKPTKKIINKQKVTREHRISFMLNDDEFSAIERYLDRYKISNKSNWYRTTIISHILQIMEEDYPTLFNENEMRR